MADIFTKEKRSWVMSRIKGKNTKIELKMKRILSDGSIKFEQHPKMYGSPDFLVRKKMAVFCDGVFWHGYNYNRKKRPAKIYWRDKIEGNMRRDKKITRRLRREGYSVLRFWEHDIEKRPDVCLSRIKRFL